MWPTKLKSTALSVAGASIGTAVFIEFARWLVTTATTGAD
jgi:hypothetical protein